ncbi:hypothetical protein Ga0466249_002255 [Sporomusaceae bacterium BoRhaA]|uniref:hypothetical protein n=1 Tax=Pelorhabdus rhamnosifermentans TaxID=2772457 RepID=UPI001C05F940|nr:hypothetical protein [Pelorhabdus rhamnosifermentans]MBU2701141.1 hypothetical protein [Pelorhabdus rhamnosifermentans]
MTAKEFSIIKSYEDNIFPKPTDAQEGLNILAKHLLGEGWITDPLPNCQANTIAIYQILSKYQNKSLWARIKQIFWKGAE